MGLAKMKLSQLIKETKGVFKPPAKKYYLGKLIYGTPYFWPCNYCSTILTFRKLIERSREERDKLAIQYPWNKDRDIDKFTNLPMVRRSKNWIFKLFRNCYWLQIGWPIYIYWNELGWKDKFNSPRFEWSPAFYIFFFKWQFVIHWVAPDGDNDRYYEMILNYIHYCDKDIEKTKKDWGWIDSGTNLSTWNEDYLVKK